MYFDYICNNYSYKQSEINKIDESNNLNYFKKIMKKLILISTIILTSLNVVNAQHVNGFIHHQGIDLPISSTENEMFYSGVENFVYQDVVDGIIPDTLLEYTISRHDTVDIMIHVPIPLSKIFYSETDIIDPITLTGDSIRFIDNRIDYAPFIIWRITVIGYNYVIKINIDEGNVGIADKNFDVSKLSVYPNPAKDIINIKFNATDSNQPVLIYSLNGKSVYENIDIRNIDQNCLEVNVSNLDSGIYFLEMNGNRSKLIIQ